MINIVQGMPGVVRDILVAAGRPMTIKEVVAEVNKLGKAHAKGSTYNAVIHGLMKRKASHGDVHCVVKGTWCFLDAWGGVAMGKTGEPRSPPKCEGVK